MCQAIPSCYSEAKISFLDLVEDFVRKNPTATSLKIKKFIKKTCPKNSIDGLIRFCKKDLRYRKGLANSPKKDKAVRLINKEICEEYTKILSALK